MAVEPSEPKVKVLRDVLLVTAAGGALFLQAAALFILTTAWVESRNHTGGCGYDGTCIENGLLDALIKTELGIPAAEFLVATLWWSLPLLRHPHRANWRTLLTRHLPYTLLPPTLLLTASAAAPHFLT